MKSFFLFLIRFQFLAILLCFAAKTNGQTFGKIYKSGLGFQLLDGIQTSDGGFALAGLQQEASGYFLGIAKLDCQGKFVWGEKFPGSATPNNIGVTVIERRDRSLVLMGNLGTLGTYNILVARYALDGTLIWKKSIGGNGEDNGNGICETFDGGLAVCGYTSSFGTDQGSAYSDQYVVKLDSNGTVVWSRTVGNAVAIDRGNMIIETPDKGLAFSGSYLTNGTFYASITKLDSAGTVLFLKSFGRPNHGTNGYCISVASNGDLLLGGSSTILKNSYMDYADNLLIRTNSTGDSSWVKIYNGTNSDNFENASGVVEDHLGNIHLMVATASYPTIGFVPNKQMVISTDASGQMTEARAFNRGGSHYPRIHKAIEDGYIIPGFSNWTGYGLNGNTFSGTFFKTDSSLSMGCSAYSYTLQTIETRPGIDVANPPFTPMAGGTAANTVSSVPLILTDTTLCENFPPIVASCSGTLISICQPLDFEFQNLSTGPYDQLIWIFEDTTITNPALPLQYSFNNPQPGMHYLTLLAIDTLCKDTISFLDSVMINPSIVPLFSTDSSNGCIPATFLFTDLSTGPFDKIVWEFEDTIIVNPSGPVSHTFSQSGMHYIRLYAMDTVCNDSLMYLDSVTVQPQISAALEISPTEKVYVMEPVYFYDRSSGNITAWHWIFTATDTSSLQNPIHGFSSPGTYPISLEITNSDGCTGVAFGTVIVKDDTIIPNIFSPNADGINDVHFIDGFKEYQLTIVDRWGAKVFDNQGDIKRMWDGKNGLGTECQEGVYFMVFEGTNYKYEKFSKAQALTLVR